MAEFLIARQDTTVDTTSPLIANFDTFDGGMPVTPNGGDITVSWNGSGHLPGLTIFRFDVRDDDG